MAENDVSEEDAAKRIWHLTMMLEIIEKQFGETYNPRVFGSYLNSAALPVDLDVVLDARDDENWMHNLQIQAILCLGYGREFRVLDLYVETPGGLFTCNNDYTGYVKARRARNLKLAIKYAVTVRQAIFMRQNGITFHRDLKLPLSPGKMLH